MNRQKCAVYAFLWLFQSLKYILVAVCWWQFATLQARGSLACFKPRNASVLVRYDLLWVLLFSASLDKSELCKKGSKYWTFSRVFLFLFVCYGTTRRFWNVCFRAVTSLICPKKKSSQKRCLLFNLLSSHYCIYIYFFLSQKYITNLKTFKKWKNLLLNTHFLYCSPFVFLLAYSLYWHCTVEEIVKKLVSGQFDLQKGKKKWQWVTHPHP